MLWCVNCPATNIKKKKIDVIQHIKQTCIEYNVEIKYFVLEFLFFLIKKYDNTIEFLDKIQFISHSNINEDYLLNFLVYSFDDLFKQL